MNRPAGGYRYTGLAGRLGQEPMNPKKRGNHAQSGVAKCGDDHQLRGVDHGIPRQPFLTTRAYVISPSLSDHGRRRT